MTTTTTLDPKALCHLALAVIETEAAAIQNLSQRIDDDFAQACEYLLNCSGRVVVLGMGKSGHIASKIAATFASTGCPAFFVHPGEASHGDMGMITKDDVVLAISYSGNTQEICTLLPLIKRLEIPLIAMTGSVDSTLSEAASVTLNISVEKEACPLGLAPTSSTTATLVMGDALAVALLETRGFTSDDFALSHPGGALGRRLLLHVDDIMHADQTIPRVSEDTLLSEALIEITEKKLGMTTVVDKDENVLGIFTDGDLRRVINTDVNIRQTPISKLMNTNYKTIEVGTLAVNALSKMQEFKITSLIILDKNKNLAGILHMHDLLRAGVV